MKGTIHATIGRSGRANRSTVQQLPNGQITLNIPRAIAHAMQYNKGDQVDFAIHEDKLILTKIGPTTRSG